MKIEITKVGYPLASAAKQGACISGQNLNEACLTFQSGRVFYCGDDYYILGIDDFSVAKRRTGMIMFKALTSKNFHEDVALLPISGVSEAYVKGFSMNWCTRDTGA